MKNARVTISCLFFCIVFFLNPTQAISGDNKDLGARIDFIQQRLDRGTQAAKRWQYSWMAVNATGAYLSAGSAINSDDIDEKEARHDNTVNFVTWVLGATDLAFHPLTAYSAAGKLKAFKGSTPDSMEKKFKYAEALLKASAEREKEGKSWKAHLAAGVVNALAGIAVATDDGRGTDGLFTFAGGMLIAEFQIFTMPTRAIDDLREYNQRFNADKSSACVRHKKENILDNLYLSAGPGRISFTYLF